MVAERNTKEVVEDSIRPATVNRWLEVVVLIPTKVEEVVFHTNVPSPRKPDSVPEPEPHAAPAEITVPFAPVCRQLPDAMEEIVRFEVVVLPEIFRNEPVPVAKVRPVVEARPVTFRLVPVAFVKVMPASAERPETLRLPPAILLVTVRLDNDAFDPDAVVNINVGNNPVLDTEICVPDAEVKFRVGIVPCVVRVRLEPETEPRFDCPDTFSEVRVAEVKEALPRLSSLNRVEEFTWK